ncbi:MAG TPA: MoaD/ThiS family protein [Euzebya sp.]|nr:MoaD/ThiS family protein [Euzebya sp.]
MVEANATVRLFAALRDAAGTGAVVVAAPVPLPALLRDLGSRFGDRFTARLAIAAVMVDGAPVDPGGDLEVQPGQEVALLPPFAGGAGDVASP